MNDIFISYAHLDDQSIDEDQEGWISRFHRVLEIKLSQLSTDRAKVGAAQASLEAESERLTAARSSLTSAGSRITDVNYARAVTKKSAAQVQLQLATAVLAHKSINPEAALYLTLSGFVQKTACMAAADA